ncbi:MAG TPA: ABC transporter ATP-binding protein, partial [Dehalococcoidia bacterium]|nr:ABC transporter ATP-binding protein [Dehalococcoidia bacterium]
GNNGAGKTTALRTVSGLLKPRRGAISFAGRRINGLPAHEIVRLGVAHVPEGRGVFGRLSVIENVEMGAYTRTDTSVQADVEQVFTLFPRLRERRHQKGGTLSGGEQQMLAIARALMARPRLLLLDEPSMGLSPLLVETIFATIQDINRRGTTILLVEQNARMALQVAQYAYVIESGVIASQGPAAALLNDPTVRAAYLGEN